MSAAPLSLPARSDTVPPEGGFVTYYLAIDGGGSTCRAVVAGAQGPGLGFGASGPANIVSDACGARASVSAATAGAFEAAGLAPDPAEVVAVLGLAGANVSAAAQAFAAGLPFARVRVVSDALISVRGALGSGDGVAAAIGTGSVFASQRGGTVRFIGGWGLTLGDHASGARMGRDLLEAALLAHDGLAPPSDLLAAIVAEAGGPEGLVSFAQGARPADFARMARRIVDSADPAARAVLARADADIIAAVDLLLGGAPVPVRFLGGLGEVFAARLTARYPALVCPPLGTALDGALALAREMP